MRHAAMNAVLLSHETERPMPMKKIALFVAAALWAQVSWSGEFARIVGIMNSSGTVEVNNFHAPRNIYTVYNANDPSEEGVAIVYMAYRRNGSHQTTLEFTDAKGRYVDVCELKPSNVTRQPWIHTVTCNWGGRLPSGGINITVFNTFDGKKENLGGIFIPDKKQ